MCDWGRDSLESWGRKRRSISPNQNATHEENTDESEDDMNISQEILVLDFGDERQSADFLRSDRIGGMASEADFTRGDKPYLLFFVISIYYSIKAFCIQ